MTTDQTAEYDVFISYSHKDRKRVEQLRDRLTKSNLRVWWDQNIYPGDHFVAEIFEQISQCSVVLVCWSRNSRETPWVQAEANHAAQKNKMVGISLDDQLPPSEYRNFQVGKFKSWKGDAGADIYQRLLRVITSRVDTARIRKRLFAFGVVILLLAALATFSAQLVSQHVRKDGIPEPSDLTMAQAVINLAIGAPERSQPPLIELRRKLVQTFDSCPASAQYFFSSVSESRRTPVSAKIRLGGAGWNYALYALSGAVFLLSAFLFLRFGMPFGKVPSQYLLSHFVLSALMTWVAYAFLSLDPSPAYFYDLKETCRRFWNPAAIFAIWSGMFFVSQIGLAGLGWVSRNLTR